MASSAAIAERERVNQRVLAQDDNNRQPAPIRSHIAATKKASAKKKNQPLYKKKTLKKKKKKDY